MSEAGLPQAWTLTLLAGAAARCGAQLSGRSALNARVNAFALELLRRVTAQANVEAGAGVGGGVKRLQRAHVEAALRGLGLARYVRGSPEQLQASQRPGAAAAKGKSRAASRSAASGAATSAGGKRRAAAGGKCPAAARGSAAESQEGGSGAKRRRPAAAKAAAPEPAPPASSKRRKMARAPKLSAAEQAALAREQDLLLARSAARANV